MALVVDHIYIPIKFDLGGVIEDIWQVLPVIERFGEVSIDAVDDHDARSYNISYLATHPPTVTVRLPQSEIRLGDVRWRADTELVIYSALGVVSVDLRLREPSRPLSSEDLQGFYDTQVAANNVDYFAYLNDVGVLSRNLASYRESAESNRDSYDGWVAAPHVTALREAILASPAFRSRERCYPFQNMRQFFVLRRTGTEEPADRPLIDALLGLTARTPRAGGAATAANWPELAIEDMVVHTSGWSTVAVRVPATTADSLDMVQEMYGQIHAQWFFCQLWVGVDPADREDERLVTAANDATGTRVAHLARVQMQLAQGLAEIGNVDLMFRDPVRVAVARFLIDGLRVERHLRAAQQRLELVRASLQQVSDLRTSAFQRRLQLLFAITAIAGVVGLFPASFELTSTWRIWTAVLFISMAGLCWLLVRAVDRTTMRRAWARPRRPSRAWIGLGRRVPRQRRGEPAAGAQWRRDADRS